MKKILLLILMVPVLSNCGQYSAMIGPSYTLVSIATSVSGIRSKRDLYITRIFHHISLG